MSASPPSREASLAIRALLGGATIGAGLLVGAGALARFAAQRAEARAAAERVRPITQSEVIILGCGSSTGVPRAACVTETPVKCETCAAATVGPPETNRNLRGNPSLLLRFVHPPGDDTGGEAADRTQPPRHSNIQIDVCKTFLPSVLRWFPYYGVRTLDSVLITHEHADACLGMDDIRSLQRYVVGPDGEVITPARLPVHVSTHTLKTMKRKFGYLVPSEEDAEGDAKEESVVGVPRIERRVAQIGFPVMRPFLPFLTHGLEVLPLPVLHGEDYVSLGFLLGTGLGQRADREAVLYISDVSRIPEATWQYLCTGQLPTPSAHAASLPAHAIAFYERFNSCSAHPLPAHQSKWSLMPDEPESPQEGGGGPKIALLIIDALFPKLDHNTHFNLDQALTFIQRLKPKRALLTGMSDLFLYERDNPELKRRRASGELTVDVELCHDGLRLPVNL